MPVWHWNSGAKEEQMSSLFCVVIYEELWRVLKIDWFLIIEWYYLCMWVSFFLLGTRPNEKYQSYQKDRKGLVSRRQCIEELVGNGRKRLWSTMIHDGQTFWLVSKKLKPYCFWLFDTCLCLIVCCTPTCPFLFTFVYIFSLYEKT